LNRKLAEWTGFLQIEEDDFYDQPPRTFKGWLYPKEGRYIQLPDFTQSLDACFKWLVPKAEQKSKIVLYDWLVLRNTVKDNALALCLAVEKLIKVKEEDTVDVYSEVLAEDYGSGGNSEE